LSLKSAREIGELLNSGHRISGELVTVVWNRSEQFKYGVLVSRHFGTASKRNRVKRLVREAVRLNRTGLPAGIRIAVLPKATRREPEFRTIDAEIRGIFDRIRPST
jgi:ribonuclease P protein component